MPILHAHQRPGMTQKAEPASECRLTQATIKALAHPSSFLEVRLEALIPLRQRACSRPLLAAALTELRLLLSPLVSSSSRRGYCAGRPAPNAEYGNLFVLIAASASL